MAHRLISKGKGDHHEYILCRWCRHAFKAITPSHLRWKHHRSFDAYTERFPSAPLFAPDTLRIIAQSIIANWERLGRHWTGDQVKAAVRTLKASGHPIHALAVKTGKPRLFGAGVRIFGSWSETLREAGVDPASVRRRVPWDEETITKALKEAKRAGLLRKGSQFRKTHSGLIQATAARWGSWSAGLRAAGLSPLRPPTVRWTLQEVRRRIQDRIRTGKSILAAEVHAHAPALKSAAQKLFGKHWSDVVRELGYAYPGRNRWDRERVITELRRIRRAGIPVHLSSVRRTNLALAQAGVRHFGTWPAVLRAARMYPD